MPLTPLPEDNTERWWIIYTNNGTTHRMMARTLVGLTAASMSTNFQSIFAALTGTLNATTIVGMEKASKGSGVRNPQTYSGTTTFGSGTELDTDGRARALSFVGRSAGGRKSRLFLFGVKAIPEGDYRVDTTESAGVASAVIALNLPAGSFLSIDELKPIWKAYANIGYSDHWIKEYRKG